MNEPETAALLYQTGMPEAKENPGLPFELYASFRPPEFMNVAFIGLYGGREEVLVAGDSEEALRRWWDEQDLERHPRLVKMEIREANAELRRAPK